MKRFLLVLALLTTMAMSFTSTAKRADRIPDSRVEVVNEQTVIFKNVIKIEIITNNIDQVTYVYDLKHSKMMTVAKGAFTVDLPMGDYLVQSDKKITKTSYELIEEED